MTKTLLWTNSSLGSEVAAQDLSIPCSNYQFIEVVCNAYGGKASFTHATSGLVPYSSYSGFYVTDSHSRLWITRFFRLSSTKLSVYNATWAYFDSGATGTTDNTQMIPYKIYGYNIT